MIFTMLAVCHAILVLAFTARILLREDLSPPARAAWFIVLILLPYFGSAIYFLFGEIDIGHRMSKRHQLVSNNIHTRAGHLTGDADKAADLIRFPYRPAFRYAASINGFHTVPGNRSEIMPGAEETLARMVRDIDAARDHVHVLYYIWLDDHTGTALAEALIRAAGRGVICRAMADGLGSRGLVGSDLWRRMETAGVRLAVALPLSRPFWTVLTSRIDLRNHRKITVIDGRITYCGSRNSADPEFRPKPRYAPWVDIMLRFEGPVVLQNQLLFAGDWIAATDEDIGPFLCAPDLRGEGFPAQVMGDGPTVRRSATPQMFTALISAAHHDITISTPYFVPDATLLEALCAAAFRGVQVRLIFPEKNDSWVVAAASRSYYRRLLEAGCEIWEYREGLLHAKTYTMDGCVTVVGSSNLDMRSFDLNFENNILLQDEATTRAVRERQETYISRARRIDLETVCGWSPLRRMWHNVVATAGPIL